MEEIVNRVAKSPLITLDLKEYVLNEERKGFDMAQGLFQGLILKEKEFRLFVKDHDWSTYEKKHVYIYCSSDAIIPNWAYMLVISRLQEYAMQLFQGSKEDLERYLYVRSFDAVDFKAFQDKKMVIKGCSDIPIPEFAFAEVTKRLLPFAASIMYGEPCSTVPVYKAPKKL